MNRSDFQQLAEVRMREAQVLLENRCFEGAYYLAGYAVECALKACIAKQIREHDFPDLKLIRDSYTHDLEKLLGLSGRKTGHDAETKATPEFARNWAIVKDWSEQDRYTLQLPEHTARDLLSAITDPSHGVLTWLKHWW